jgi:type IV pilus assembly protein PilY1
MSTYARRNRVMYVGANDGMLHGVAAGSFVDPNPSLAGDEYYTSGDGHELFGYVPGALLKKVKLLPRLDTGKEYFVDGASSAADVWIDYDGNGLKDGVDWTTALLSPLREGGESVLALDVTNPAATSGVHGPYPRLMWEFTHAGLGQTWSKPIITRVKLRGGIGVGDRCGVSNGDGDCVEEWVAIFGAGYRPEGDPNLTTYNNDPNVAGYTTKGRGVYIVRVKDGSVLARLSQGTSAPYTKMKYAIPAEPAVIDLNFDGFADVVYVGDLGGQLWKWDLSAVGVPVSGVVPNTVWPAGVIFEAPVSTVALGLKHYHSIFQSAAAAFDERVLTLSFASGERANLGYRGQADPNSPSSLVGLYDDNNRFWVLKDRTPTGAGAFPTTLPIYEAPLLPAAVPLAGHGSLTDVTNSASDPNTADEGYFFRVKDAEKFMTNHLIFDGNVVTASYTPDELNSTPRGNNCALSGQTSEWAWRLSNAGASLDDPINVNQLVRTRTLGNGAPTDPRISVSKDSNGAMIIKITAQTSVGEVLNPDGGDLSLDPVDMIYWHQSY